MKTKEEQNQITRINKAFETMHGALRKFAKVCESNGSPLRSISFTPTKCSIVYKRVK
jgi:hypothetical protein